MEPKCQYKIGCHACPIEKMKEDFRVFRMAVMQFIMEGNRDKMMLEGHSIIRRIDEWYEPHTTEYKPMFKEE